MDFQALSNRLHAHEPQATQTKPNRHMRGDHALNPSVQPGWMGAELKEAAVLVAITKSANPEIVLTKRTQNLSHHPGQISFPGGRRDGGETAVQTALREANEEIGLQAQFTEILGHLDPYFTSTGYRVIPVVAALDIEAHPAWVLSKDEVAQTFAPPFSFLMDFENHEKHQRKFEGAVRHYFAMTWQGFYIWGATAGMLRNLAEIWGD